MREIVLDTETTGLDPAKGDRLVEIGCVEVINRFVTGRVFHRYLNPERPMPAEAFAVHGLSDAFLLEKPLFREVVEDFLAFIADDPLVIHNASFDTAFLNAELRRAGRASLAPARIVDTLTIARRRHPGQQNSLDALCARYSINNAHRTRHGALLDAELLAEVYAELTGGKQSSLGLGDFAATTRAAGEARSAAPRRLPEIALLSAEEIAAHRAFIAEMGENALWNRYLDKRES
jgi:DNA polymerase-3 subunit epsilon